MYLLPFTVLQCLSNDGHATECGVSANAAARPRHTRGGTIHNEAAFLRQSFQTWVDYKTCNWLYLHTQCYGFLSTYFHNYCLSSTRRPGQLIVTESNRAVFAVRNETNTLSLFLLQRLLHSWATGPMEFNLKRAVAAVLSREAVSAAVLERETLRSISFQSIP
ncbi:hypothetical protein BJX63DRAFT_366522 [Aspergillus granulosus]|uniref:Secreted protein n=1 Tax=Aspergillus granulosus TaxID=176169 RepID=A0ABR4H1G5_9EURO